MAETSDMPDAAPEQLISASVNLSVAGRKLRLDMQVPTGPTAVGRLLPVMRTLTDAVVAVAVERTEAAGAKVSCGSGCGACCRQLVPVSPSEARRLAEVVEAMPEPRRSEVIARFRDAVQRLTDAGLIDQLDAVRAAGDSATVSLGLRYFALRIACPFLVDESCSVYAERPLACREYLVTSPARHCANPRPDLVKCVELPSRVSNAAGDLDTGCGEPRRWLPLAQSLDWVRAHARPEPARTGTELVQELFKRVTGRDIPPPPG